jgi:hypothetical protein
MEIIKDKLLTIKSSTYSGENKCNDRQIKQIGDEQRLSEVFQMIQWKWRCFPKVDLCVSKLNRLVKTYASIIPRKDPDNISNALRADWSKIKGPVSCTITSSGSSNSESITEVSRRREDSYFDSALMERSSMVKLIKKPDYFDYTTVKIRKHVNEGEDYEINSHQDL